MFKPQPDRNQVALDEIIADALSELAGHDANSDEYATIVDQLSKLYELKTVNRPQAVSRDTLVAVAGNLLGIVVIVGHERAHVITSKALNFVGKFR